MPAPLLPPVQAIDRARARRAIQLAEQIIADLPTLTYSSEKPGGYHDEKTLAEKLRVEFRQALQVNRSFILALLCDEYVPAKMFKPWASVDRICQWRADPAIKLDVIIRHKRCCVKPSAFFNFWNTLPDTTRRKLCEGSGDEITKSED